jgi:DMSO/TMAO reductase YedYZ molybdopterin-dependent catalytic subunit
LAALELLRYRLPVQAASPRAGEVRTAWSAQSPLSVLAFPSRPGEEVLPWLDQPAPNPVPEILGKPLKWEDLDSWITTNDEFFTVKHFSLPQINPQTWSLELTGLVERQLTFSLDDLKARPSQEVTFTLECSGNHGLPFLIGAIGNATWTGTPLAPILEEAGVLPEGIEVVFWGADSGPADVNGVEVNEQFARSMSLADAMDPRNMLCYSMNGEPLPADHGGPVRLIAPGWFGIANVKWLERIELLDTRYQGRFMAREYVTQRASEQDGIAQVRFTSVGRKLLKSAPAKVTRLAGEYRVVGAAWGAPIARVEVQIDGGDWMPAALEEGQGAEVAWTIWSVEWGRPADGEHTISSRAIDTEGNVQPALDDPLIANKLTFWESNGQIIRRVFVGSRYVPGTDYPLSGEFQAFWNAHGGLAIFGNPITEEFDEQSLIDGNVYRVQYFERQRFELHPENAAPYNVQLGLLGIETLPGGESQPRAEPHSDPACEYFDATGHNVCGRFREYWHQHGGLAIFGYPITEEFELEREGQAHTVQYFERARFEYHPANQPPHDVLLGLLGLEVLLERYG